MPEQHRELKYQVPMASMRRGYRLSVRGTLEQTHSPLDRSRVRAAVPIAYTFGPNTLVSFKAWTDRIG